MGIKPRGHLAPSPVESDDVQSRWGAWLGDLGGAGETAGGVIAEVDSKASSSNEGVVELAAGLSAAEARITSLEEAVVADDIATKQYVDVRIGELLARIEALENPAP